MTVLEPGHDPLETLQLMSEQNKEDIRAHGRRSQLRLFWLFVTFMVVAGVAHVWSLQPGSALVSMSGLRPSDRPALCPGDTLEYIYSVDGAEDGVVDIDVTVYRETPPSQTIIYSTSLRDILVDPVHQETYAVWKIPTEVINPFTGQIEKFVPGDYQRRISISTTSRNRTPEIAVIGFSIRLDCP